jgi:hypothetical protein
MTNDEFRNRQKATNHTVTVSISFGFGVGFRILLHERSAKPINPLQPLSMFAMLVA